MQILMKCAMLQLHRLSGEPYNCIMESPGLNSDRAIGYSKWISLVFLAHLRQTAGKIHRHGSCMRLMAFLYSLNSLWILNNVGNKPENKSGPHISVFRSSGHSFCPLKVPMQYETNMREDLTETWRLPFAKPQSPPPIPGQRYRLLSCTLFTWTRRQVVTETLQLS